MFDSTFFKFLIAFVIIIGLSFLAMGIAGGFNKQDSNHINGSDGTLNKIDIQ